MSSIDNRVVGMEFDNVAFEKKMAQTIASLDKLNQTLEKQNGKKALEDLGTAASKFNLHGVTEGIEAVSTKFLAMSTIGITALSMITSKAISAGISIAKSLSLDQVISGFQEYETNMNSIQTIMSNTRKDGTTLDQVGGALKQLNEYSDQTIYNFGEMARNIGTFTAAGIDLDTSVESIKGIANLAAASGSSSEQAASAMYQLSQALASGTVKLMDWNSVVNAGMGGEMFQEALFNAGKLKGTLDGVKADTTFTQWKDAGNTFRDSLESGWITADVLTTTLQGFTGDLTEAQVMAMGYTQAQAAEIVAMGQDAKNAATKVKTFTQLIGTVKEAIGSGWSESFKIIIGDFEEAKELFTGINEVIGGIVADSAKKRNDLLQGWKDLGGRTQLIESLGNAFGILRDLMTAVSRAFREFFPPMTAEKLFELTEAFGSFIRFLTPGAASLNKITRIFRGVFAAIQIGFEVVKGITDVFVRLFAELFEGVEGGGILQWFAELGDKIVHLHDSLVTGGGIEDFFHRMGNWIKFPEIALIQLRSMFRNLKDDIVSFLSDINIGSFDLGTLFGETPEILDRVGQRFQTLKDIINKLGDIAWPIVQAFGQLWSRIEPILSECLESIKTWFSELGGKIAESSEPGDYDAAIDTINVGLLGGIAALLVNFMKNGLDLNIGGGFLDKINEAFGGLTGTLEAMQAKLKSEVLMNIAKAIALLTASVLVLSLIDSEALAKALSAMAVGFTELLAAFAVLNKLSLGPASAAQMAIVATGLIVLAGAMLILSVAAKIFSTMSWEDLAKGLGSVTVLIGALSLAVIPLSKNSDGMIRAGIGILAIAGAMAVMALAAKIFATMNLEEVGKGLLGISVSLAAVVAAMNLMPKGAKMLAAGVAVMAISLALIALAAAVKLFSMMSWEEMGQGLLGVAGALGAIALGMQLMPATSLLSAAALVGIAYALGLIADAVIKMGSLDFEKMKNGIGGLAAVLGVLALAALAMTSGIAGAAAILIMSVALGMLADVLEQMSKLSLKQLGTGLLAIAAVLGLLAGAALLLAPAILPMLALGAALALIGVGMVLFGAGVALTAAGFATLAKAGQAGISVLLTLLDALITRIPAFAEAVAAGILQFAQTFLEGLPVIIEMLGILIEQILQTVIDFLPELIELVITGIQGFLEAVRAIYPDLVETGIGMIMALLQGISDNIGEIVTIVATIIAEFLNGIAENLDEVIAAGLNILESFIQGISDNITTIIPAVTDLIVEFIGAVVDSYTDIIDAGADAVIKFVEGIASNVLKVIDAGFQIVVDFLNGLADSIEDHRGELADAGWNVIDAIFGGILDKAVEVIAWFTAFPRKVLEWIGNVAETLLQKGRDLISGIYRGAIERVSIVKDWFGELPGKIISAIGGVATLLYDIGKSIITSLWNGMKNVWENVKGWLGGLGNAIVNLKGPPKKDAVMLYDNGGLIMQGLHKGMQDRWDETEKWLSALDPAAIMQDALSKIPEVLEGTEDFNPTITPVLDLTNVVSGAKAVGGMFSGIGNTVNGNASAYAFNQAKVISAATLANADNSETELNASGSKEIKFEQNIYAPKELSTADIYRQTRNIITVTKEELAIP